MLDIYRDLAWLERPPVNFRARLKDLAEGEAVCGRELRALATYALDVDQLARLGRVLRTLPAHRLAPLTPLKLALCGNGTLDVLVDPLIASAARHGFALQVVKGHYDQALQDALSPTSEINSAKPDVVLLVIDWRGLPLAAAPGDRDSARAVVDQCLGFLNTIRGGIAANSGAVCIAPTFAAPPEALFGSYDRTLPGAVRQMLDAINQGLAEQTLNSTDVLLDVAAVAETYGLGAWFDPAQWNLAKLPFAADAVPLYADHVGRLLAALRGKSRRLLVLDCDNTLWGGVIGDDGMDGIRIAQGDAVGEAHLTVQQQALALRDRGVVLAICSKNDDRRAREVFESHPEMLMRPDHIAVFQANWEDKATNIKAIADELALGLESVVFLDDNPMERDLVRRMLPEVAVPELGEDPAYYSRLLTAAGYFELTAFSDEDRQRAALYQSNARRVALMGQAGDFDAYLRSLDMEIVFAPFDSKGRARIAQLISKSNQFNLTTRRYSELEVQALADDPSVFTLQVRLKDVFGDNGMISVVICRELDRSTWEIDTWLMSCRVLGRGVERMVLRELQHQAKQRGVRTLVGLYLPTARNGMVAEHYPGLGFEPAGPACNGGTRWTLDVDTDVPSAPMKVVRQDAVQAAMA